MSQGHTTGSLAELLGAELVGPPGLPVERLETLERATPGTLTFIRSPSYAAGWKASKATAALVSRDVTVPDHDPAQRSLLLVPDADLALARVLELFAPRTYRPAPGIHPSSVVDPTATLGQGVAIGPCCWVGPGAKLADGVVLMSNIAVGAGASVGRGTILHPTVVIGERCNVGQGCILHGGVVIGADGFGYRPAPDGRGVVKIPHNGIVEIGDMVEIGANSCIDRAKFGATVIGSMTKIDNHVQIGHNCTIGRACLICGMAGIAGSVTLGDGVVVAGHVGIADNLTIGPGATLAGKSAVMNDVPAGETWWGFPARPYREAARGFALLNQLVDMGRRLRKLESDVQRLTGNTEP